MFEMAPRLMPVQLEQAGGAARVRHIEGLDSMVTSLAIAIAIAEPIGTDLIVFSVGIRPQDARLVPAASTSPSGAGSWSTKPAALRRGDLCWPKDPVYDLRALE
jgi:hypothetical protein